jgi:hypothetical protein
VVVGGRNGEEFLDRELFSKTRRVTIPHLQLFSADALPLELQIHAC